jgi:glucose-6-phosphate isomerase
MHEPTITLTEEPRDYDGLNYLSGKSMEEVNGKHSRVPYRHTARVACRFSRFSGSMSRARKHGPCDLLTLSLPRPSSSTALGENPFDQPGVEDYKKAMYRLLGKQDG